MANSSDFGYNGGLDDNPFSDLVSHTTRHSTTVMSSIHDKPSQPTTTVDEQKTIDKKATTTTISSTKAAMTTRPNNMTSQDTETTIPSPSIPPPSTEQDNQSPHLDERHNTGLTISTQPWTLNEEADASPSPDVLHHTRSPDSLAQDGSDQQSDSLRLPESGARPSFEISVEDPQKVGDAINAYIVYRVKTKTDSPAFRSSEFVVARRYRDFLWLYNQLTNGNPGVVVPPVPEKHALGRFQEEFVELRRIALERCLQKTVSHPMLYGDPDLKVFLESDSFNVEKHQKRAEPETPRLGFMRSFGETISSSNPFSKAIETDDWFASKKSEMDALETQLKTLLKAVEGVVKQRKELGGALSGFGESMFPLASAELNRDLSKHLTVMGDIQKQLHDLHEEQARYDILTLEHTIDEYIRIIASIRISFNARARAYQTYQQAASELQRTIASHDKLKGQQKPNAERMATAQMEILEIQQKVEELERDYNDMSKLIKNELDRFDHEKALDFKTSVEAFLYSMIEHQKKVIGLWESYFEQTDGLDGDDDDGLVSD
ncbi:hypothetical protein [Absidia glauca]|uniref:PX domain-containing protein n=1 Tax=Absidia glauca TaxID=4829 RepID=A0A163K4K7_ABSGL|nr:hypothetical protein [Absidia glauca]